MGNEIEKEQLIRENERLRLENEQLKAKNEELENEMETMAIKTRTISKEIEQLIPTAARAEQQIFTISRVMEKESKKAIISTVAAASCLLGFIISLRFGVNTEQVSQLQFESLKTLGKYYEDIGPLAAILQTSAFAFCLKTSIHLIRRGAILKPFSKESSDIVIDSMEKINMEEEENVRKR